MHIDCTGGGPSPSTFWPLGKYPPERTPGSPVPESTPPREVLGLGVQGLGKCPTEGKSVPPSTGSRAFPLKSSLFSPEVLYFSGVLLPRPSTFEAQYFPGKVLPRENVRIRAPKKYPPREHWASYSDWAPPLYSQCAPAPDFGAQKYKGFC